LRAGAEHTRGPQLGKLVRIRSLSSQTVGDHTIVVPITADDGESRERSAGEVPGTVLDF